MWLYVMCHHSLCDLIITHLPRNSYSLQLMKFTRETIIRKIWFQFVIFQVLCASNEDHSVVEPLLPPEGAKIGEQVSFSGWAWKTLSEIYLPLLLPIAFCGSICTSPNYLLLGNFEKLRACLIKAYSKVCFTIHSVKTLLTLQALIHHQSPEIDQSMWCVRAWHPLMQTHLKSHSVDSLVGNRIRCVTSR